MNTRNTIQRTMVLDTVKSLKTHPSAEEIYNELIKRYPSISLGTVYRNLNMLSEAGEILKIEIPNSHDCFDFNISPHYHFKCTQCGRVYDIEAVPLVEFERESKEGFLIEDVSLIFRGVCSYCRNT